MVLAALDIILENSGTVDAPSVNFYHETKVSFYSIKTSNLQTLPFDHTHKINNLYAIIVPHFLFKTLIILSSLIYCVFRATPDDSKLHSFLQVLFSPAEKREGPR